MLRDLKQPFRGESDLPENYRARLGGLPTVMPTWTVKLCILLGTAILVYGASLLLTICSFLALHQSIGWYHPLITLGMTGLFSWYAIRISFTSGRILVGLSAVLCLSLLALFSLGSSHKVFDRSLDGQTYPAEAVLKLSEGWNPFYEPLPEEPPVWSIHLPFHARGPRCNAAALYKLTGDFNQAKAFNGLYVFASFFLSLAALSTSRGVGFRWVVLLSALLALIQRHPTYGYRRLWALLRFQTGVIVNHKAVYWVLRQKRWLVHQRPCTSRPRVRGWISRAGRSNERWAIDVTHIPCGRDGWAHLTAVVDSHDREVIAFEFALRVRAKEAERAVEAACLARFGTLRPVGPTPTVRSDNGLIFQSRRFRQACRDYRLQQEFIPPYTPEQNGIIERFFRGLKEECVW